MKLSEGTLSILKNFSTINPSLLIKPGSVLKTISPRRSILAAAEVTEDFPNEAGIYELPKFLATLSLMDEPDIEFKEKVAIISENRKNVTYTFAAPAMIISPPEKTLQMPEPDISVEVPWKDFSSVLKASGVLRLPEISFEGNGEKLFIKAIDSDNPTADNYAIEIGETDLKFKMIFKNENFKILADDYTINLTSKGMAHFHSDVVDYWIVMESNSTFEG